LPQLDALRGVAALVVVFNHYVQTVPEAVRRLSAFPRGALDLAAWASPWPWLRLTPLRLLVEGEAAVDIFFVLSGFVLALGLTTGRKTVYWDFIIKRICRIYVPFSIVTIGAAILYIRAPAHQDPMFSQWLNTVVPSPGATSLPSLVRHLLMLGQSQDEMILNPVMWSLIHELRISFLIPFMFWSISRFGALQVLCGCTFLSVYVSLGLADNTVGTWQATGHFLWMFAAGSMLSLHRVRIARRLAELGKKTTVVLWGAAILLLTFQFDHDWSDFTIGIGACFAIGLCLPSGPAMRVLASPIPLWLGRVSYSLYLTHFPVMVLTVCSFGGFRLAGFACSLIVAEITFRLVESPAHRLAKLMTRNRRKILFQEDDVIKPIKKSLKARPEG